MSKTDIVEKLTQIQADISESDRVSAKSFNNKVCDLLTKIKWIFNKEVKVSSRGDGRTGRVDIVVTAPVVIGLELDRENARIKSKVKLCQVDGYRFILTRSGWVVIL